LLGNLHEVLAQLLVDLIQALSGKILAFSGVDDRIAAFDADEDDVTRLDDDQAVFLLGD